MRIREADHSLSKLLTLLLQRGFKTDVLLIVEAGELGLQSSLRRLFEDGKRSEVIAIPCYLDDGPRVATMAQDWLIQHGVTIQDDARHYLGNCLPSDRLLIERELEKLLIFMGDESTVTLSHVQAIIDDNGVTSLSELAGAVASREITEIDRILDGLWFEGYSWMAILRSTLRHFQRLHEVKSLVTAPAPQHIDEAMNTIPIFFKQRNRFRSQVDRWSRDQLAEGLEHLRIAELECKKSGRPAEVICSHCLFTIAHLGGRSEEGISRWRPVP